MCLRLLQHANRNGRSDYPNVVLSKGLMYDVEE